MSDVLTDTITIATWEQATDGRRDTNPFDHVETTLLQYCQRVGAYDIVRSYSDELSRTLPEHIDFVDNRFVAPAAYVEDIDADRAAVVDAIQRADARHRALVDTWLS